MNVAQEDHVHIYFVSSLKVVEQIYIKFGVYNQTLSSYVRSEVLTAAVMNVVIFWDIAPCSPFVNQRFRRTYDLHLQGKKSAEQETSV
jgi:hypothetical protein